MAPWCLRPCPTLVLLIACCDSTPVVWTSQCETKAQMDMQMHGGSHVTTSEQQDVVLAQPDKVGLLSTTVT